MSDNSLSQTGFLVWFIMNSVKHVTKYPSCQKVNKKVVDYPSQFAILTSVF